VAHGARGRRRALRAEINAHVEAVGQAGLQALEFERVVYEQGAFGPVSLTLTS
jgi:hypothetical protein